MKEYPIRVFLVDDDEDDYVVTRDLLAEITGERYLLEWVTTYDAALEALEGAAYDIYLFDYRLGERTGIELLKEVSARGCQAPIILLTGQGDLEIDLEAMSAGAADYLVKGKIDAPLLDRSIRYAIERRRVQDELLHSQQKLLKQHDELNRLFRQVEIVKQEWERTLDCIGDMVILTDEEGKIKRCNRAFKDFLEKSYTDLLDKDLSSALDAFTVEKKASFNHGVELSHPPTGKCFLLNSYPFHGTQDGLAAGSVTTIHDTTELKKITTELEDAYNQLKDTQSQMLQREKMASIGQLAAGVAHEINNPMGFISSNLSTLGKYAAKLAEFINAQAEVLDSLGSQEATAKLAESRKRLKIDYVISDLNELLKESLDGADRVKKIVQGLKNFSRVDAAEIEYADINECIESTLNIAWNELKYKATVEKDYGTLPRTSCRPQQLNQVFMNLLINAAHAIEQQGVIAIRTWSENGFIYASIADTGCGITAEKINRIFEPFFTTKEIGKGTGLGLSIAYDIVQKHNGEINVVSEEGKGTTFTIKLPVVDG